MCGFDNVVVVVVRRASVVPVSKNIEINFHLNDLFSMVIMVVVVVVNVIVVVLIVMALDRHPWQRLAIEIGAAATFLSGLVLASGSGWAAAHFTVIGVAAVLVAFLDDEPHHRRWMRWVGSSALAVAYVLRLVASEIDVYAPCAMGGAISDEVLDVLRATIICGAANNQLAHPGMEKTLADRGVLYTPDYVANAGGLVQVADEAQHLTSGGFRFDRAKAKAAGIYDTTLRVFELADSEGVPPAVAADRLAERRMRDVGRLRGIWVG